MYMSTIYIFSIHLHRIFHRLIDQSGEHCITANVSQTIFHELPSPSKQIPIPAKLQHRYLMSFEGTCSNR